VSRRSDDAQAPLRQAISAPDAPKAMGAYSPAIRAGNLLFVSGQIPIEPASGNLVTGDIAAQAEQVMKNVSALLKAAGAGFDHVVRTTVYLTDMNEFAAMNEVYSRFVVDPPPARATVQVARLPRDVKIEVDVIAMIPEK
jgi:2-iminobutanoate/2-iminopropanoate deaminase